MFEAAYVCSPVIENDAVVGSVLFFHDISEQEKLRHSVEMEQERSRRYFDVAGVIMVVLDREGNIVLLNRKGSQILGESADEAIGKNWFEHYIVPEERAATRKVFDALIRSNGDVISSNTNPIVTRSGSQRLVYWKNTLLRDEEGKITHIIAAGNDITDMEELKSRLLESEKLYELTFEQANVGIAHVALDGSWREVNKSLCEILGYTKDELLQLTFQDITHPDDLKKDLEHVHALLEGKIPHYQMEKRYLKKDGSPVWANLSVALVRNEKGEARHFIAVIQDITQEQHLKEVIKASEEKLRIFIHYAPAALAMFDTEMHYMVVSRGWLQEYKLERDDILGESHYEIFPEIPSHWKEANERALQGEVVRKEDDAFAREDGSVQYISWEVRPWYTDENRIGGIVIFTKDVTQQHELIASLHEKEELMIAQSRLAAMGEMLSMIAHQWRQPLTTISMSANNLLADVELQEIVPERIMIEANDIIHQTQYLSRTIEDFRNFFKADKEKEMLLMGDLFQEALRVVNKSFEAHSVSCLVHNSSHTRIPVFAREMQQVLINILRNAKEALVETRSDNREVTVNIGEDALNAQIRICNNGGSIATDLLERIFEPYFSTKEEQNGTGLGLYMSKTIIEKHMQGTLHVNNIEGGVCFNITLPIYPEKEPENA